MTASFQAIIFDLDGTLVDSEPIHCTAWLETLAGHGLEYDHGWFEQWIGTSDRTLAEHVIREHALELEVSHLQLAKQEHYHRLIVTEGRLFNGVAEALDRFGRRFPLAIATNSSRLDAEHVFKATGLDKLVRTVVTADDVDNLKPEPDIFLLAAERLAVAPGHCVVIEDSPAGSEAAHRAGMYVLGLTSSQPAERMGWAHELFARTELALARLEELV